MPKTNYKSHNAKRDWFVTSSCFITWNKYSVFSYQVSAFDITFKADCPKHNWLQCHVSEYATCHLIEKNSHRTRATFL